MGKWDMNVQELINKLMEAPDKSVDVYIYSYDLAPIDRVGIDHNIVGTSNKVVIFADGD